MFPILYNALLHLPSKTAFLIGNWSVTNTCLLGPTPLSTWDPISVVSAIVARNTVMTNRQNDWQTNQLTKPVPHTHNHFMALWILSRITRVSLYQKGKTNLDFTEATDSEWQWHQLGHVQICTSPKTDNHSSTPPLSFITRRMPFLPPNQQHQNLYQYSNSRYCYIAYTAMWIIIAKSSCVVL